MYAKCIWKMYEKPIDELDEKDKLSRPTTETVINALEKTIQAVSLLPKPRHGQTPILEPHYKVVSVVHKLVARGDLPAQEGADILKRQPLAIDRGEEVAIRDSEDWEPFVIKQLRHLRDKDKHNWQHRIIVRHARILFDVDEEGDDSYVQAKAAFSVLRESMFTKTMVLNVWKCDAERPGRHHVYTEQYVRLMTKLLTVLNDRINMEAVLRRIRKKGADFYHFTELWQSCVAAHVRLLRRGFHIPPVEEDVFKAVTLEAFDILAERITDWCGKTNDEPAALTALKEAMELKKLNAGLTKAGPIDDLIVDCYSTIYTEISSQLPGPDPSIVIEERNKDRELGRMSLDGAHDAELPGGHEARGAAADGKPANGSLVPPGTTTRGDSEIPEAQKMEKSASNTGEPIVARTRRFFGVRRPDILRKAEQAVMRATEQPPKSAVSAGAGRKGRLGSMSSAKHGAGSENGDGGDQDEDTEMKDGDDAAADGDREAASEASSPPGSVHDSADDESDLSDVPADYEDNAPPMLLFPNLRRSAEAGVDGSGGGGEEDSAAASTVDGDEEVSSPPEGGITADGEENTEDDEDEGDMDSDAEEEGEGGEGGESGGDEGMDGEGSGQEEEDGDDDDDDEEGGEDQDAGDEEAG